MKVFIYISISLLWFSCVISKNMETYKAHRIKREPPIYRPPMLYGVPINRPKPVYGPPKLTYGSPEPIYSPPKPVYGPPSINSYATKPIYSVPGYRPTTSSAYGTPPITYDTPNFKPSLSYRPPSTLFTPPSLTYGPPPPAYGPPLPPPPPPPRYPEPSSAPTQTPTPTPLYPVPSSGFDSHIHSYNRPTANTAPLASGYRSPSLSTYSSTSTQYGSAPSSYSPSATSYGPPSTSYIPPSTSPGPPSTPHSAYAPPASQFVLSSTFYRPTSSNNGSPSPYNPSTDYRPSNNHGVFLQTYDSPSPNYNKHGHGYSPLIYNYNRPTLVPTNYGSSQIYKNPNSEYVGSSHGSFTYNQPFYNSPASGYEIPITHKPPPLQYNALATSYDTPGALTSYGTPVVKHEPPVNYGISPKRINYIIDNTFTAFENHIDAYSSSSPIKSNYANVNTVEFGGEKNRFEQKRDSLTFLSSDNVENRTLNHNYDGPGVTEDFLMEAASRSTLDGRGNTKLLPRPYDIDTVQERTKNIDRLSSNYIFEHKINSDFDKKLV